MSLYELQTDVLRYERKFFISELGRHQVESLVKLHPAMFSEIYQRRFVNNVYFDSPDMSNYVENVDGTAQRIKLRIRWYGEQFGLIDKPVLEIKIKNAFLVRKASFALGPMMMNGELDPTIFTRVIEESDVPEIVALQLKMSQPVLHNRYSRKYFRSSDGNFRITIDTDNEFYRIAGERNSFFHRSVDERNLILELKYGIELDNGAADITDGFPFRLTKHSKYVSGIDRLLAW